MPGLEGALQREGNEEALPLQRRLLDYLEANPGEVFCGADAPELAKKLGGEHPASVEWAMWAMNRIGLLGSEHVGRHLYVGSHTAIKKLRAKKGPDSPVVASQG